MAEKRAPSWDRMAAQYPDLADLPHDPDVVFPALKSKLPTRQDVRPHVAKVDSGDPIVPLKPRYAEGKGRLMAQQGNMAMEYYTWDKIYLRESFLESLLKAARHLGEEYHGMQLVVPYGYRPPSVQAGSNERVKNEIIAKALKDHKTPPSGEALLDEMNIQSAEVPIAGHTTFGAADVFLRDWHNEQVSLGILKNPDSELFWNPFIPKKVAEARDMLAESYEAAGNLYTFYGESGCHVDHEGTPEGAYNKQLRSNQGLVVASAGPLVVAQFMPQEFRSQEAVDRFGEIPDTELAVLNTGEHYYKVGLAA